MKIHLANPWTARSLLRKKQTDIAAWLGFPDSQSAVKILRKLPPDECTVANLLHLRDLFPLHAKELRHLSTLNSTIIRLLFWQDKRYRLAHTYMENLASETNQLFLDDDFGTLEDLSWMRACLGEKGPVNVNSYDHLYQLHDKYVERMGSIDLRFRSSSKTPFPDPPFEASSPDFIVEPLRTEKDLMEEGRVQRNCVGSYGGRVRGEKVYLYAVLAPERATMAIGISSVGVWSLKEIKSESNRPVAHRTLVAAQEWLDYAGQHRSYECEECDMPF